MQAPDLRAPQSTQAYRHEALGMLTFQPRQRHTSQVGPAQQPEHALHGALSRECTSALRFSSRLLDSCTDWLADSAYGLQTPPATQAHWQEAPGLGHHAAQVGRRCSWGSALS